jgi:hypothetical protein
LKPLNIGTGSTIELEGIAPAPPVKAMRPEGNTSPAASAQPAAVKPPQLPIAPKSNDSATSPVTAQAPASDASGTKPPANSTDPVVLSFNPAKITTEVGQRFNVDLVISNVRNLSLAPLLLQYDSAKLQVTNVSNGGFLAQGEQVVAVTQRDDPATGAVHITATRPPGTGGASGRGTLVTLTFTAKAEGRAGISIAKAGLRNSNGQLIPSSGLQTAVEIKQASNPPALTGSK